MSVHLSTRTKEQVVIFWEKTQDAEIMRFFPGGAKSIEEALSLFDASQQASSASFGKVIYSNDKYVGDIWCYSIDEHNDKIAMLSIVIFEKTCWRQGIASEAIKAFVQEVFAHFRIDKIGAYTYSNNFASIAMLNKSGFLEVERFVEEGIESQYFELSR